MNPSKHFIKIEKIAKFLFLSVTIVLPFLFLPKVPVSIEAIKGFVFSFVVLASFVCWLLARLIDANIAIPKTPIIKNMGWFALSFTLSALISPVVHKSFWGNGFEFGTAFSVIMLAMYGFLAIQYLQEIALVKKLYKRLLISFVITTLLSFTGFFFANTKFTSLFGVSSNTSFAGSWNDLAIFSGGIGMIVLLALYTTQISKFKKIVLNALLVLILAVLALINFTTIWLILGVFALLVFVYILTFSPADETGNTQRKIPMAPFCVIIVCLLFLLGNNLVSGFIARQTGFSSVDVKPSLSSTATVFAKTVTTGSVHAVFGFGPNRFSSAWALYHPVSINQTDFWNTPFSSGYGFLPSLAVTGGILGLITIVLFVVVFVLTGIRLVFRNLREKDFNFWVTSSFLGALYLWFCCLIYSPSLSIMMLTFLFTALFVATLREQQLIGEKNITYLDDPRKSFFGISLIVVLLVASLSGMYLITEKYISLYSFGKGVTSPTPATTEKYLLRAVSLDSKNELFYKTLSSFYLSQFNTSISSQNPDTKAIQQSYELARSYADGAVNVTDITSAENWRALGDIYVIGLNLKNTEAYNYAAKAYEMAKQRDPKNPISELSFAQLEYANQNYAKAVEHISSALVLKNNYADAYVLLARINHAQNKDDEAVKSLDAIAYYYPTNATALRVAGSVALDLGLNARAVVYLQNSFVYDNSSLETAGLLVRAYRKTGNNDDSNKLLSSLRTAFVGNQEMLKAIDTLDLGTKQAPAPVVDSNKTTKTTKK
ncbi:MAG: hypothetical protein WCO58_00340 [bacterium]